MDAVYRRVPLVYTDGDTEDIDEHDSDAGTSAKIEKAKETSQTTEHSDIGDKSRKPNCVSTSTWERFQAIKKRTDAAIKRSTEKRIKLLQKSIIETVQDSLQTDEEKDILREHDVKFGPPVTDNSTSIKGSGCTRAVKTVNTSVDSSNSRNDEDWKEVQSYLCVNDHMRQNDASSHRAKSGLEKRINTTILTGDVHTAETLSDKLATRDFGVKISGAFAARDFVKRKKDEEAILESKKRKKLSWGFDHKKRWETKSNM